MRDDGGVNVAALLGSLARQPGQLPQLLRLAFDARAARAALFRGRRLLGAGLGFPHFPKDFRVYPCLLYGRGGCDGHLDRSCSMASASR